MVPRVQTNVDKGDVQYFSKEMVHLSSHRESVTPLSILVSLVRNDRCLNHSVVVKVDVQVDEDVAETFSYQDAGLEQNYDGHLGRESLSFNPLVLEQNAL